MCFFTEVRNRCNSAKSKVLAGPGSLEALAKKNPFVTTLGFVTTRGRHTSKRWGYSLEQKRRRPLPAPAEFRLHRGRRAVGEGERLENTSRKSKMCGVEDGEQRCVREG